LPSAKLVEQVVPGATLTSMLDKNTTANHSQSRSLLQCLRCGQEDKARACPLYIPLPQKHSPSVLGILLIILLQAYASVSGAQPSLISLP